MLTVSLAGLGLFHCILSEFKYIYYPYSKGYYP
jgi:hypothetical protein